MKREIEEAIRKAVIEADQDEALSRRLVAWFDEVSSGNEMLTDKGATDRRLERLYEDTTLPFDLDLDEEWTKWGNTFVEELIGSEHTEEDGSGRSANGQDSS